jgi:hypothetical protein
MITWVVTKLGPQGPVSVVCVSGEPASEEDKAAEAALRTTLQHQMQELVKRYDNMGMREDMDKQLLMDQHMKIAESAEQLQKDINDKDKGPRLARLMFSKRLHVIMAECASEMAKRMLDKHPDKKREYEEEEAAFKESYKTYFCTTTKMDPSEYEDYFFLGD